MLWRVYRWVARALLYPLARLVRACGPDFRFIKVYGGRIGHLVAEPDMFLKERALGRAPRFHEIVLVPWQGVANRHVVRYWARHLRVVQSPFWARVLAPLAHKSLLFDVARYFTVIDRNAEYCGIQMAWGDRPPLLSLDDEDREFGRARLRDLGMPDDAWFVCVHCRGSGYAPNDRQTYRDAEIESYVPAMRAISERGGWCVRMGDATMPPLPDLPRVIDWATHAEKSERMDVFLCAAARAFLGSASGLAAVATVFGVPVALANQIPLSCVFHLGPHDLTIPKRLWSHAESRELDFAEILASPVASFRFDELYGQAKLAPIDNTPDEIVELLLELLETLDGTLRYSAEDEALQRAFRSLMRPDHYTFGAPGRLGRAFLQRHRELLGSP
jgi:putative glycosyltransferase (TIGR04372 family)